MQAYGIMDDALDINKLVVELSDLEVALLLCFAVREHCRIDTTADNIHDVAKELALICTNTFNRTYAILDCFETTSFDEFCTYIIPANARRRPATTRTAVEHKVVDVVIAKNFNHIHESLQAEVLELMRSKKLVLRDTVLQAPTDFIFVPLLVRDSEQDQLRLNPHLNDHFIISHFHDSGDGYVYLEDNDGWLSDSQMSASSVVRKSDAPLKKNQPSIDQKTLDKVERSSNCVIAGADICRYQQDIVVFLRLSRAVAGGVSVRATVHFRVISRLLATLHGIDYLTPSIVALAAKKVFRHRIVVAKPEDDRSLQYGSDLKAVSQVLAYATPDTILESVLTLETPV
ncbi:hypothetical protein EYZ11_005697 [Aspergillus tanneri]|uniref:magnesium chelatase n=1 Tax=Aspergillus tanneri TaxID=1220188 RepID=A0A4S3JHW5_9EURO|nr:uncharacterized protein ATNIH1004_001626 [Aspergillus tanneri]KAA8652721.1 hypothetical protein ATNIH1004_001626 [Aspergillus tanneri]THC94825.1 hypothetical protein EYZ11_005697 [Aspergillus tanneri]